MITTTPAKLANEFACYQIDTGLGGTLVPFYIGVCKLSEVLDIPDAKRNTAFQASLAPDDEITVMVCATFERLNDARQYAVIQVALHKPHCNMNGTTARLLPSRKTGRIHNITNNDEYPNASAAASALGVTAQAVSQHLDGKSHTVARCKLERIDL